MRKRNKTKKNVYSCIEESGRGEYNPINHIKRWGRNIKHCYQRIKYGYCDRDVWSIDWWFLSIVPNMLEDLRETTHGYPGELMNSSSQDLSEEEQEKADEAGMQKWRDTLSEMIFLFREALDDTCTRENPYEEEHRKAQEVFDKKYGIFGEGLLTKEDKAEEKKTGTHRMYMLSDVPEYKDISDKYHEEWSKIQSY